MELVTKRILKSACFTAGLLASSIASAGLMNTDFSQGANGFDYWNAEVITADLISGDEASDYGDIISTYSPNFSATTNAATLTTTEDADFAYYSLVLSQDFTFDAVAAGNTRILSFDMGSILTDAGVGDDFAFAQLRDLDSNRLIDLTGGVTNLDVTDWIGVNATLEFGLIDGDFMSGDSLSISNLSVTETFASVPEPSSLALLALGLFAIRSKSFMQKKTDI